MHVIAGFFVILLVIGASLLLGLLFARPASQNENKLVPFSVLLINDNLPATRAFLEYYASQIAWMDSEILKCMLLVYPEENTEAKILCEDMSREHEFFTASSVTDLHKMLDRKLKNLEIS